MPQKIIGLDIGTYSVKALLLDPTKRGAVLQLLDLKLPREALLPAKPAPANNDEAAPLTDDELLDADDTQEREIDPDDEEPEAPVESLPAWVKATGDLIRSTLETGDLVALPMPHQQAMTVHVPVPFADRNKLKKILPGLLYDRIPLGLDEVSHDFTVTPDAQGGNQAIVGFARREQVAALLSQLATQGIDPACVAVPELIMERVAHTLVPDYDQGSWAMLDLGHKTTRLLVIHEGHVALARTIQIGGFQVTQQIARAFNAPEDEAERVKHAHAAILPAAEQQDPTRAALSKAICDALRPLIRELRRSLQSLYARERIEVTHIHLTGGSSRISYLDAHLSEALSIPCARLDPGVLANPNGPHFPVDQRDAIVERGTLALGMALAIQSVTSRQQTINLRQGDLAYRGSSPYLRSQLVKIAAAAACLFVLLIAALLMQHRDRAAQRDAMRNAVTVESKKLFGTAIYNKADVLKRLESKNAEVVSVAPKMSAYVLLFSLVEKIDPSMSLEISRLEVDLGRNLVQVYGVTSDPQAVDKLVTDLEALKCLRDVKRDKLQVRSETEASFELQINAGGCT